MRSKPGFVCGDLEPVSESRRLGILTDEVVKSNEARPRLTRKRYADALFDRLFFE